MDESYGETARWIDEHADELASLIVEEQWKKDPGLNSRYSEDDRQKCIQDVRYNLRYLSESVNSDSTSIFSSYIDWLRVLFAGLNIPEQELRENLEITRIIIKSKLPSDRKRIIDKFIDIAIEMLGESPDTVTSFLDDSKPLTPVARDYLNFLLRGNRNSASRLIMETVENGANVRDIYLQVFQPCQYEIGRLWQMNRVSVAQEHYCTAATQLIMSQLYPLIFTSERNGHSMIAVCAGSELHEIGVRMVADFFEMEGWDTYYLGANTPADTVIQTLKEKNSDILAISTTMTFHIKLVRDLIEKARSLNGQKSIGILVGGYPFNIDRDLWKKVGADGYADNAQGAISKAHDLIDSL